MNEVSYKISIKKYLNDYELLNKYNIENLYDLPHISNLKLRTRILNFQEEYKKHRGVTIDVKLLSGLYFYSFFGRIPEVSYHVSGNQSDANMRQKGVHFISVDVSNIEQISDFLKQATMEKGYLLKKGLIRINLNRMNKVESLSKSLNRKASYNLTIPADCFYELNEYIKYNTDDLSLAKTNFDMSIVVSKVPKNAQVGNLLRNLFFF